MMQWDDYFLTLTQIVALKSKDRSTKVGATIVGPDNQIISTGFNGFPIDVNDDVDERHQRPDKYLWTEHAERNAIFLAARRGSATEGCRMYLMFSPAPCVDCTRAVIQSGISEIITPKTKFDGVMDCKFEVSLTMLEEAGVIVREADFNVESVLSEIVGGGGEE